MPTLEEHVTQARHNEELFSIVQTTHPDWAVTSTFYAALHYVMALALAHKPMAPLYDTLTSHDATIKRLRKDAPRIHQQYRRLFDASWQARYNCHVYTEAEVNAFRDNDLDAVKAYVRRYLPSNLEP